MFKIEITASTAVELGEKIAQLMAQLGGVIPDAPAAPTEDAPKARRRTAAKTTGETENGAASEPAPSEKPALVADDVDQARADQRSEEANAATAEPVDEKPLANAEPTQEDKDALLKQATEFSQAHGHDALLAALKAVDAERFSAITFDKYPAFRAAMKNHAGASALS